MSDEAKPYTVEEAREKARKAAMHAARLRSENETGAADQLIVDYDREAATMRAYVDLTAEHDTLRGEADRLKTVNDAHVDLRDRLEAELATARTLLDEGEVLIERAKLLVGNAEIEKSRLRRKVEAARARLKPWAGDRQLLRVFPVIEASIRDALTLIAEDAPAAVTLDSPADMQRPWPLCDVLQRLADFADDRLTRKNYDGHGWEELSVCVARAREILTEDARHEADTRPTVNSSLLRPDPTGLGGAARRAAARRMTEASTDEDISSTDEDI
jgi:hypothetical protein